MTRIVVIGGGYVGQLVQFAVPDARVLDGRTTAPADHLDSRVGPQYLWEPIPGCPSESFPVTTLVDNLPPTPEAILAYKQKIGKENDGGNWGLQFQHQTVGYSSALPVPRVEYDSKVQMVDLVNKQLGVSGWRTIDYDLLIITVPLPLFLNTLILGPDFHEPFKWDPIYMAKETCDSEVEGMILNYHSSADDIWYRDTRVKNIQYFESLQKNDDLVVHTIPIGKIHPNLESETILAQLTAYDCYCFGRFAAWRPDELAHETWRHIIDWKEAMEL